MNNVKRLVFYWSAGFIFSCLFIWAVAAVFKNSVTPKVWDEAVGRYVNEPQSVIRNRTEGWADFRSGIHGLTYEGEKVFFSSEPKFLFWGDSFADGIQVAAEERAVNVYNAMAPTDAPRGVAVADSGLSVADFYFYIPRYENLTKNVTANVFLLAGMRSVVPGQHLDCHSRLLPDPWRFELSDCPPSEMALRYAPLLNKAHADFLHFIYSSLRDYSFRFSVGNLTAQTPIVQKADPGFDARELEKAWRFMLPALKEQTGGKLVFLYVPLRPSLSRGTIATADADLEKKQLFQRLCAEYGATFIDMTEQFAQSYAQEGKLGQGFFNTPQGVGHLNAHGQAMVARGLYEYFAGGAK